MDSLSAHISAAHGNLTFINMVLGLLPEPSTQATIFLNQFDTNGFTPLMLFAKEFKKRGEESRQFVESIISVGADKNVVHATTGLSALGYFRERIRMAKVLDANNWHGGPSDSFDKVERCQIEQILTPERGPTRADEDVLSNDESDDETFDDEHDTRSRFDFRDLNDFDYHTTMSMLFEIAMIITIITTIVFGHESLK